MLNTLKKNQLAGNKKFVGFDTSDSLITALKSGEIQGLVAQNPAWPALDMPREACA